jgi:hypothetical protein
MDWQTIVSLVIVAFAAAWIVRRIARIVQSGSRDGAGHVSNCGHCPKNPEAAHTQPLVPLGVTTHKTPDSNPSQSG